MEGNIEGQISDIQYGEASASEGAHSSCTKAFVWIGLCYFPPSRVVKIPVVIAAVWCSGPLLNVMAARV